MVPVAIEDLARHRIVVRRGSRFRGVRFRGAGVHGASRHETGCELAVVRSSQRRLTCRPSPRARAVVHVALSSAGRLKTVAVRVSIRGRRPTDHNLAALHRLHADGVKAGQLAVELEWKRADGHIQPVAISFSVATSIHAMPSGRVMLGQLTGG